MKIGIFGAGQLGRMLGLAAIPLGHSVYFYDEEGGRAVEPFHALTTAPFDDERNVAAFAASMDVVTFEFENIPLAAVEAAAEVRPMHPNPEALSQTQDRLAEKELLLLLGIPSAPFEPVAGEEDLMGSLDRIGLPAVLKTRELGYDGKGQAIIRDRAHAVEAWRQLGEVPCILERFISFDRELSLIAARSTSGETAFYRLTENEHRGGILHRSVAPAPRVTPDLRDQAVHAARLLFEALDYVGVLAIEFFEEGQRLLVNEIAPRVHNSGHWTIKGAETSQFENHIRAITGMPLGSPRARGYCSMINLVGEIPSRGELLAVPGAYLHDYGKTPRAGRKLGHVTLVAEDHIKLAQREALLPDWVHTQRAEKA